MENSTAFQYQCLDHFYLSAAKASRLVTTKVDQFTLSRHLAARHFKTFHLNTQPHYVKLHEKDGGMMSCVCTLKVITRAYLELHMHVFVCRVVVDILEPPNQTAALGANIRHELSSKCPPP